MVKKLGLYKIISSEDGVVHLKPDGFLDHQSTFCGDVDTNFEYTETNNPINCQECQAIYRQLKHGIKLLAVDPTLDQGEK